MNTHKCRTFVLLSLSVAIHWPHAGPASVLHAESNWIEKTGLSGGIVVALDFDDGRSIAKLAEDGPFLVHGLLSSEALVAKARDEIRQEGLYGKVSCDSYNGRDLPYVDSLVNVVFCTKSCKAPDAELMRVLVPGGLLMMEGASGWKKSVKPAPDNVDEWNQFLHSADNNGVSLDDVGPPQRLRWHDTPEYGRSKALSPSFTNMVSAGGILMTIEDRATTEDVNALSKYYLVARDAYNGIELWKRPMKEEWIGWQGGSIKSISTQQQRCLAAIGNTVYICTGIGGPVTALDSRTGAEKQVYKLTEKTAEFLIEGNILYGIQGAPYKVGKSNLAGSVELYALALDKGTLVWNKHIANEYTGGTFAVKGGRVVYHSTEGVTCLDSATGEVLWTETVPIKGGPPATEKAKAAIRRGKKPSTLDLFSSNIQPTLVLTDDTVFCAIHDTMTAKSLADGKTMWTAPAGKNYMKSTEIFVTNGLVWSRDLKGREPKTGKVVRTLVQEMTGPMSHDRCYRNRITHRYYLNSATGGTDFLGLDGNLESPNPWARSTCGLAVMPANGMIYNGPYVCQCAIGTMASGVNALYNDAGNSDAGNSDAGNSGSGNSDRSFTIEIEPRLVKGPAFGKGKGSAAAADDWPTYRHSSMRSGVTPGETPESLAIKWKVDVGTHPTAPVVAGGSVYVADRDSYTLCSLNRENGETRWTFIADGRIDSPPTYHQGMILVGSRGGSVYCLRASDGQLAWKFNGMPQRRLICDTGRLESAWPVNGSVMIYEDTAYFAAGRSSFLDGGIGVFALDPATGTMKHGRMVRGPYEADRPSFPIQADGTFQLDGFKSDIFSSHGSELFVRNQGFTPNLEPINPDDVKTLHLMASAGFLNDSPQHRTYWTVDQNLRYGGATGKFSSGPAGDTIAFDGKLFYEVRGYPPGRNLPGRGREIDQLELYSVFSGRYGGITDRETKSAIPAMGRWEKRWNTSTPFAGHAIVASENTVMAAGVPMLKGYSAEDTSASYAGEKGGIAWLLDAKDGHKLQELRFDSPPVWDGIAIAHGSFLSA